jgi:voltage-gated potassium channel
MLRLLRLLRVFHLTAYMKASRLIVAVFRSRKNELLISLALTLFLLIISSCLMYFFEHPAQPDKFTSIPHTFWWSIITLTTVGYGDLIPITVPGRILTGVILLAGIALFALPAGIITSGFLEEARKRKRHLPARCPHCGELLEEEG